ncbi:MAG: AsmA family protein [Acidiferrobacter thiooxydans]
MALTHVDLHVLLKGARLGRVHKATSLPLLQTGPFRISGWLTRHGKTWDLAHFRGLEGKSDLGGTISVCPGHPMFMHADLTSRHLNFKDLAGFVQAKPKKVEGHVKVVPPARGAQKVLPVQPYKRSPLMKLDANVVYRAAHVYASHMRIQDLYAHLILQHGVVCPTPLHFGVADGLVAANYTMNVSQPMYRTHLQAIARGVHFATTVPTAGRCSTTPDPRPTPRP